MNRAVGILAVLIICMAVFAQSPLEYAGSGVWSGFEAIVAPDGDYVFAGFPYGLGAFDVSDSMNCFLASWAYVGSEVTDIAIRGDYAYLAAGDAGFAIVDISDPENMVILSTLDLGESANGVDVSGNIAVVAGRTLRTYIIDISSHTSPSVLGNYPMTGGCMDVLVEGNLAYVCRGLGGFTIIDFTNPASPTLVGNYSSSTLIREAAKSGDYVYLAAELAGITVLDVSNPATPTVAGTFPAPSGRSFSSVVVQGDRAYVGGGNYGLLTLDITDPTAIEQVHRYPISSTSVVRVSVRGGLVFMSTKEGLMVIDVSIEGISTFVSRRDLHAGIEYVWGSGSRMITSAGLYGIDGFNMPTPFEPVQTFSFANGNRMNAALFYNNYIYTAEGGNGVGVYRSPSLAEYPTSIRMISIGATVTDVARVDTFLYAMSFNGITQLRLSDPENPMIFWDAPITTPNAFYPTRDYVFVGKNSQGLIILETEMMTEVGRDESSAGLDFRRITVYGDYAYVAGGSAGLHVFDVSDPTSPALIRTISTPDVAEGLYSASGWLYVAVDRQGVAPFRIIAGDSLEQHENYPTGGRSQGIFAEGDFVYVADRYAVIVLHNTMTSIAERAQLPQSFDVHAYPNPFNSAVRISVDYPAGTTNVSPVQVDIFDIAGRRIDVITNQGDYSLSGRNDSAGELIWSPQDNLPSGVYLVRTATPDGRSATQRVLYLK